VLAPGDVLRVGSSDEADLALPQDRGLASVHFEMDWDGERSEVRSLRGHGSIRLNGAPAFQAWAKHGSWIQAGDTVFLVYYEGHTPPRQLPLESAARRARVEEALAGLSAEPSLYGVLDAARAERVLVLLRSAIDEHQSLYVGRQGEALAKEAPYLVRFVAGSRLLRALVEEGWGEAWGIYLAADEPMKMVRRHLRRLLMVEKETSSKRLYFRFYDPRVIRDFLPLATPRQESELFGDLRALLFEGPDLTLVRALPKAAPLAGGNDASHP
jgi:hypothetical protein